MQVDRLESFIVESVLEQSMLYAMLHDDINTIVDMVQALPPTTAPSLPLLHKLAYLGKQPMIDALLQRCNGLFTIHDTFSPMRITPLHAAAVGVNIDVARALLAAGANIHAATEGAAAVTPLDVAIQKGCLPLVRTFVVDHGVTPLTHHLASALRCDFHDIAVFLLQRQCRYEVLLGNEYNSRLLRALEACGLVMGSTKFVGYASPDKCVKQTKGNPSFDFYGRSHLRKVNDVPVYESAIGKVLQSRIERDHSERIHNLKSVKLKPVDYRYGQLMKVNVTHGLTLIGTVRFQGPVEGHEGTWLGLELPVPLGTHDGIIEGRRYYTTAPNHALMCRNYDATPVMSQTEIRLLQHHNQRYYQNVLNQERMKGMSSLEQQPKRGLAKPSLSEDEEGSSGSKLVLQPLKKRPFLS